MDYFKSIEGEKQSLNEVKVLLIGDGGAGKTSLIKQLLGEEFDENQTQTHGINIKQWEIEGRKNKIKVNFWDFGGQEIMHATHQFFLSKRSLYILVLDSRKDEKTEYWLKYIESFGGDSPILVILNKMDENLSFDVNRRFLQEKYPSIKGFYRISCRTNSGIEKFSENLKKELLNVEHLQTIWAKSWINVKSQLENMTNDFISYDRYSKICEKENIIDKSSQDTLVDFLNDLGIILHFKDFKLLDTHVLEPKWVTEAVYKVINSKKLAKSNGLLRINLLDEILKQEKDTDYYYPPDKYTYIIDLMRKFELCYKLNEQTVLLPDLLEIQEPKFYFDYDSSLKFLIEYDFLPKSIMPRFIVKMHKDIKDELRWRTGVVLNDNNFNSTAVIKADENDRKIYIYVDGEQKRDYFSIIRKTFNDINDSFEKLDAKELVPLPENDKIAIEYEELIGFELEGRKEIFIGKLRKVYSIRQLLDGIEDGRNRKLDSTKYAAIRGDVIMGDKYIQAGQGIMQGPGSHAQDMTFNQIWSQTNDKINLLELAEELAELRIKLKDSATEPEHDISIGAVATAERLAKEGNGPEVLEYLSKAGKWALDTATKIGVPVATEALKTSILGL